MRETTVSLEWERCRCQCGLVIYQRRSLATEVMDGKLLRALSYLSNPFRKQTVKTREKVYLFLGPVEMEVHLLWVSAVAGELKKKAGCSRIK